MSEMAHRVPEKVVQRAVIKTYLACGCRVFSLSQPRATMQTPGLPDLYVFCPRKGAAWWHETKAADGALEPEQVGFALLCQLCGAGHVVGGTRAAQAKLEALGLLVRVGQ